MWQTRARKCNQVRETTSDMRWSVVVSWAGIHRYVQGISEGLRSTRILQNKRVCVKFLFGGWGGAQTPEFLGGCHCSAQPLDNANTPYSEAGWREARATTPLTKIRRNSKLFAHPIAIYPARNERIGKGIDETNIRICIYTMRATRSYQ